MKRALISLALAWAVAFIVNAQILGDLDGDGKVTVADITDLISTYLEQQEAALHPQRQPRAVLLDVTFGARENELSTRNVYSADYMLELAGVPFVTTASLTDAIETGGVIVLSSEVGNSTFSEAQYDSLRRWVEAGGVLVSQAPLAVSGSSAVHTACRQLYGIEKAASGKNRYQLVWAPSHWADKELEYIDTDEERVTSLGRGKRLSGESIKTYAYTLTEDSATQVLAHYETGENAVVRRSLGRGAVYTFGFRWRDIIQRSQLNKDFEAQRSTSNAYEPSADVVPLFIRSVCAKHRKVSVWKFTIPDGYESLIIPTHDCDSRTAYDSMFYMSEYERALKLKAHYFLTVHYFRDAGYLSAFYDDVTMPKARLLLADGHTVGSHSVCHFPDFSQTDRFPMTVTTREAYAAVAHHEKDSTATGTTTGGSTWVEVVMSKQIIENDLQNQVRSFRTGHLCLNKNIPEAEQMGGYSFASCYSAGDVLSEFPFRERLGNDWSGDFNGVLQMPLHISDVISSSPINAENWMEKPAMWHAVQSKLQGNYAPAILLIHPNRSWKMEAEKMLVEMTDRNRVGLYNFEDFGDFWNFRRTVDFDFGYSAEQSLLEIRLTEPVDAVRLQHLCFAVDVESGTEPFTEIRLLDADGRVLADGTAKPLTETRWLIQF